MNQKLIKGGHTSHFTPHTSNRGITLIALVITIIVLLILAGVTINMVLGDDGIIGQAQGAEEVHKNAEEKQQYEINNAYKEILRTEKNISGIKNTSKDNEETTITKKVTDEEGNVTEEKSKNNFYDSLLAYKDLGSVKYNGNIDEAKANANIIKLNKRTYTEQTIDVVGMSRNQSLVIDLNGYELIYTGLVNFVQDIRCELYIIDTSENKTGKIIMLNKEDYTYQERLDLNNDGVVCDYDMELVKNARGKSDADEDWKQYSNYDLDGDSLIDIDDLAEFDDTGMYEHVIFNYAKVYTDVAEGALISECIHNK